MVILNSVTVLSSIVIFPLGDNLVFTNNKRPTKVNITTRNTTILLKTVTGLMGIAFMSFMGIKL